MVYADIDVDTDIWFDDGGVPWTPLDLGAALKGWWNADDHGTANMVDDGAGLISSWKDRVSGYNPTATTTARPTWSATAFNSTKAGVTGNGTTNVLRTTANFPAFGSATNEIWLVLNNAQAADAVMFQYGGVAGTGRSFGHQTTPRFQMSDGVSTTYTMSTPGFTGNLIAGGSWNGTIAMGRINGVPATLPSATISSTTPSTSGGALTIFGYNTGAALFAACTIRHVIVTTLLTLAQRELLEGYLAWDGGIVSVLPAYHPYKLAAPTTVRPFWPTDLGASLVCWWNADDHGNGLMTDDGAGLISSWRDRIALVNPVATTTARPTWTASSFNSSFNGVVGSGVNVMLLPSTTVVPAGLTPIPVGSVPGEMWMVVNSTSVVDNSFMFMYGAAAATCRTLYHKTVPNLQISDGVTNLSVTSPTFSGNFIVGGYWSGTTQGGRANGADTTPATGVITSLATPAGGPLTLFGRNNSTLFAAMTLRHAFITTLLTGPQREQLEGWCAWNSGMVASLPSGHPYKSVRP